MSKNEQDSGNDAEDGHIETGVEDDMVDIDAEFERLEREKKELAEERERLRELRRQIEREREELRKEEEAKEGPEDEESRDIEREKVRLEAERKRIAEEKEKIAEERKKLDILFEEIASRRYALEQESNKVEEQRAALGERENTLKIREEKLLKEREEFEKEKAEWQKEYAAQLEEIRKLPDMRAELELERENLRLERVRIEEERKLLEDERRMLDSRRKTMDEEREILDNQRRILEEQKKRLLETGGMTPEIREALEAPPVRHEKGALEAHPAQERPAEVYDVGKAHLDMTRTIDSETEEDRKRRERLKRLEEKIHSKDEEKNVPTMTCLSCGTPIPIPPDASVVKCPKCGREYKIRGKGKPKTEQKKPVETVKRPVQTVRKHRAVHTEPDIPTPFTSVIPNVPRNEAIPYEREGKYYITCQNPSCRSEIELPNPHVRRVQCPVCGRRNKVAPLEEI